ncbi:uncharacterized protein KY384_002046 [Bacidia gigantensis]|uniref:uncharacterized protein n=1 Tax=Bacidia gigantensis TaxID=2732470 RepID=UPI001D05022A|nr:uncharacterized protein KY384_002046 [Bacidia gigantensis]KAG8533263.1 hypothetical protein KY384_002046 [Bacidia gigantensis]
MQALFDIDVQSDISPDDEAVLAPEPKEAGEPASPQQPQKALASVHEAQNVKRSQADDVESNVSAQHASLATPAVRGILKELEIDISAIKGTGRDGRVLKDDVHKYAAQRDAAKPEASSRPAMAVDEGQIERPMTLTPIQSQMFKTMTRSLNIPHFVFADEIDITALKALRSKLNNAPEQMQKLSYLHFIVKAVSLALEEFPLLNARVDESHDNHKPQLIMRGKHNIGIAMDTAQGLLVPNIKNVASRSIKEIAAECTSLQVLAKESKLSAKDLAGGTITVSNVGSVGGTYVAPVIVQSEVAILGLGKARTTPAFNEDGSVVRKQVMNFSWSADHRVVDGATMARMAERVKGFIEAPEMMVARLR